jgi:hypothetical protein
MSWKNIRLELASVPKFPEGSPHRCYLLHLPLEPSGFIDETILETFPRRATVRRFWPSQADMRGYVIRTIDGWAFSYDSRDDDERVCHLDTHPIRLGERLTLTEPDGERLPFNVTNVEGFA